MKNPEGPVIYTDLNLYPGHVIDYSKEFITITEEEQFNAYKTVLEKAKE